MIQTEYSENSGGPTTSQEHRAAGHWLLAKMGKRVLRPGGIELTRRLLDSLGVATGDRVVELGPGIGRTAQLVLEGHYATYTGVDPNADAREQIAKVLAGHHDASVQQGDARENGLPSAGADVVISEAMLTMQSAADKSKIAHEVFRTLAPGGRWGMHELSLKPDDVDQSVIDQVSKALSRTIKVGARPLTTKAWIELVTEAGFEVEWTSHNPMKLVDPTRIIADEGLVGALRFFNNVRRNPDARKRILAMRKVFHENQDHLEAVALVAHKPFDAPTATAAAEGTAD